MWNSTYNENRKKKYQENPEFKEKRIRQSKRTPEEQKTYMQAYAKANPSKFRRTPEQQEKYNERRREKYAKDNQYKEQQKTAVKQWQQDNPHKRKAQRIKKYSLSIQSFHALMESQNYKCAICGYTEITDKNFFPVVDHCHASEIVRGILCMQCNMGLGKFKDSPELLEKAADYLRKNGAYGVI